MQATLSRIAEVNPQHNAIVSLVDEEILLTQASQHDALLAQGKSKGWLHGIPQAPKDLANVEGLITSMGSPLMKDFVAPADGLMVSRMRAAGAIMIGKTNTPEFGLGSHTFNEVFGATRNALDLTKTAGGSSGGAAVALSLNMLSVADGSDFMGSLRNPAAWNNIYGMRPSQGRIPMWPSAEGFVNQLGIEGPMARTVEDMARLLQIQAGYDDRVPLSIKEKFIWDKSSAVHGLPLAPRIGWLGNLNGYLAMDEGLLDANLLGVKAIEITGAKIESIALGYSEDAVWQAWLVWRAALVASRLAPFAANKNNHSLIKPEALWEYESGQALTLSSFMKASAERSNFFQHLLKLFEQVDFLLMPTTQVWPFAVEARWPKEISGRTMDTYHRWMESVIYATFAGLPAISIPCPLHQGRPSGLQLIGRPQADLAVLQMAARYEQVLV